MKTWKRRHTFLVRAVVLTGTLPLAIVTVAGGMIFAEALSWATNLPFEFCCFLEVVTLYWRHLYRQGVAGAADTWDEYHR